MLQRIQSLYLAIVVLLYLSLFILPLSSVTVGADVYTIKATGVTLKAGDIITSVKSFYILIITIAATVAATLFCIAQFKNRQFQLKLCNLVMLLIAGFLVLEYFIVEGFITESSLTKPDYTITSMFPAIALVLVSLAKRAIKKDEDLVRSADRLR